MIIPIEHYARAVGKVADYKKYLIFVVLLVSAATRLQRVVLKVSVFASFTKRAA